MDDRIGVRLDRRVKIEWSGAIGSLVDTTPTEGDLSGAWEASNTETSVVQLSTSGSGTDARFTTVTDGSGNPTVTITTAGTGYADDDTIVLRDAGSTSSTATITILTEQDPITDFYTDANHDVLRLSSGNITVNGAAEFGPIIKITGLNNGTYNIDSSLNLQQLPRVGQRFTSSSITGDLVNNTGVIYKIISSTSTANEQADIKITPSVAKDASWDTNTILTFEDHNIVYVVETGEQINKSAVAGTLANGTPFSRQKGNLTPAIFAGISYDFRYQFSQQFVKNNDNSINSGRLQLRNFEVSYANTGGFEVEVSPRPYDSLYREVNTRAFTGKVVGTVITGIMPLETGVLRVPVYCNSKDVRITVNSKAWLPLALQSADWEALQVLRSQRI
jgi:hypothetical protein